MTRASGRVLWVLALLAATASACASAPPAPAGAPKFPDLAAPTIPPGLAITGEVRDQLTLAWTQLQAGDRRSASRVYGDILKRSPAFYPAETGMGLVALAGR